MDYKELFKKASTIRQLDIVHYPIARKRQVRRLSGVVVEFGSPVRDKLDDILSPKDFEGMPSTVAATGMVASAITGTPNNITNAIIGRRSEWLELACEKQAAKSKIRR